jgi:hypothetical protein
VESSALGPQVRSDEESKLTFKAKAADSEPAASIVASMSPFRPLL